MTDPIKQKIQELVPDIDWQKAERTDGMWEETITIAIVLRAIGKKQAGIAVSWCGEFMSNIPVGAYSSNKTYPWQFESVFWNLEKDSWDSQSKKTQEFIGTLLGVTAI